MLDDEEVTQHAPAFERERYQALRQALGTLAAVCDGAILRDDVGFNGTDTRLGHFLAWLPLDLWPLPAFRDAWGMLRKYRRQLASHGIDYDALPEPPSFETGQRVIALFPPEGFLVLFSPDERLLRAWRRLPGALLVEKPVRHYLVRRVPGGATPLLAFAEQQGFHLAPGVKDAAKDAWVALEGGRFALYFSHSASLNAEVKAIRGWSCSQVGGFHWLLPTHAQAAAALAAFLARHPQFAVPPEVEQLLPGRPATVEEALPR